MKICRECKKTWYYPISECIYCGKKLEDEEQKEFNVIGITEVFVPSLEHTRVPYYELLLEDEHGNFHIKKSFKKYTIDDRISKNIKEQIEIKIAVIGTGITGTGIIEVALYSGFDAAWVSRSEKALNNSIKKLERSLLKSLTEEDKNILMSNLKGTIDINEISDVDLVIESVVEDIETKKKLFLELDKICDKKTILASNTSSLSIDELGSVTERPEKIVGMHFFNPIPKMHLAEIVRGSKTSDETVDFIEKIAGLFIKTSVIARDSPCFIVNRILMPYLNEAVYLLDEGIASKEDIDTAAKLGLNHPMGPIALLDLIGLDVFMNIMQNLYTRTNNPKFIHSKLVEKMVKENKLGRKTGEGFYKYSKK